LKIGRKFQPNPLLLSFREEVASRHWDKPVVPEVAIKSLDSVEPISPERPLVCDTCCERVALLPCNSIVAKDYRLSALVISVISLISSGGTIVSLLKRQLHR